MHLIPFVKKLLIKLEHYEIRGVARTLIQSYLSNRFQFVAVNNFHSAQKKVKICVPQGSVIGPLLFLIYINDLQNFMSSVPRLFVDDTVILLNANSVQNLQTKIYDELSRISNWMSNNKLTVKPQKSHALIINP